MKVNRQLFYILTSVTLCFFGLSFWFKTSIDNNIESILYEKLTQIKTRTVQKAFNVNTTAIRQCTNDYSLWDDFVSFMAGKNGTNWIKTNLDNYIEVYHVDYYWIADTNAHFIHYNSIKKGKSVQQLDIAPDVLKRTLADNQFATFFTFHNHELVEVFAAPIQPSVDKERKSKPAGYFLTARIVDKDYIENLKAIIPEINFELASKQQAYPDSIEMATCTVKFNEPMKNAAGETIAVFNISRPLTGLAQSYSFIKNCLVIFLISIIVICMIFYITANRIIIKPLHLISLALQTKTVNNLQNSLSKKNEFGTISNLIVDFLAQNKLLEEEINIRTISESNLKKALFEKEKAQQERREMEFFLFQQQELLLFTQDKLNQTSDEKIRKIIAMAAAALKCERSSIWFADENCSQIESEYVYQLSTNSYTKAGILLAKDFPTYFSHLTTDIFICVDDAQNNPVTSEFTEPYLKPLGITSMLDVPLRINHTVIGVICFEHIGPVREWSTYEQMYVRAVSNFISLHIETENRKKIEEELQQNQIRFEETEELAQIGSWEYNLVSHSAKISKELYRIFEFGETVDVLQGYQEKIHPDDLEKLNDIFQKINSKQHNISADFRIVSLDGQTKYIFCICNPILNEAHQLIGIRGSAQDVTQQKMAALAKSEFLSCMSHEIRTPINGVVGIAHLLSEENLSEKQKEYVDTLNFSAQHLSNVVSDILDFSKIESGYMTFEKVSFNLDKNCKYIFDLFTQKASEKNIQFTLVPKSKSQQDKMLIGDYVRLNQVLSNLLSNAIKFTDSGFVELTYEIISTNEITSVVKFTVKDSGIGMTAQQQKNIFDSFTQANSAITRQYGGTGLGLTISKKLVELQSGNISVNSKLGIGSKFEVLLPFETKKSISFQNNDVIDIAEQYNDISGMKILIAEDNAINAMVLQRFLDKWNVYSEVAVDGEEAVELFQQVDFDLILMDIQMPKLNGIEATKIIRSSFNNNIPVVAFTADASIDTHRELLKIGFNKCFTKPFNPDQLFSYLRSVFITQNS